MTHEPDATNEGKYATGGIVNNPFLPEEIMTHEPDIIREAEAVVEDWLERPVRFQLDIPHGSVITHAYVSLNTPIHGLDNPEPTVRFTYDGTQDDPGDTHTPR